MTSDDPDRKIQRSATLPKSLVDRARNAVYWTRNVPGEPDSYSALTERGVRNEVERLEATYNEGQPFDEGELRPGPAPGVMEKVAEMRRRRREQESGDGVKGASGEGA